MEKPTRKSPRNAGSGTEWGSLLAGQQASIDLVMGARLARQLGISPTTFWRWRQMAGFPKGLRIRQHNYFSRSAVMSWIDQQQSTSEGGCNDLA
ncbi:MAG: helix-turn-helix domain-containing protein [Xanthobacteraceae bacterium]